MSVSKQYFADVAGEWDEIRSGFFTEAMRDSAIRKANLPEAALVGDVGTGTGFVLSGLVDRASHLYGFDASDEMLAVARQNLSEYDHVTIRRAEGEELPVADGTFDAVFANMYLHHAPRPLAAIKEIVRTLKPGGKVIIIDLDQHDQAWMREAMADRWLGFAREDIVRWYHDAGLTAIDVDCAEGTCDCTAPAGKEIALSIFVAIGEKPA